jgi:hypothetical protein
MASPRGDMWTQVTTSVTMPTKMPHRKNSILAITREC